MDGVLVLNKGWTPICVESLRETLLKLWLGKAQVVDEEYNLHGFQEWCDLSEDAVKGYVGIGSTRKFIKPDVIRLLDYDKVFQPKVKLNRYNIFARDRNTCAYCGKRFRTKELTLDHVIPRCQGGRNRWENLVTSCVPCNHHKAHRTPKEAQMVLLRQPVMPERVAPLRDLKLSRVPKRWADFVDLAYWNVEIEE